MYQYQKDYPRPQLSRKSWENLNGEWDFAFDDKKEGLKNRWQENNIRIFRMQKRKAPGIDLGAFF